MESYYAIVFMMIRLMENGFHFPFTVDIEKQATSLMIAVREMGIYRMI